MPNVNYYEQHDRLTHCRLEVSPNGDRNAARVALHGFGCTHPLVTPNCGTLTTRAILSPDTAAHAMDVFNNAHEKVSTVYVWSPREQRLGEVSMLSPELVRFASSNGECDIDDKTTRDALAVAELDGLGTPSTPPIEQLPQPEKTHVI